MAQVKEKNPSFRTKETICKDLETILAADLSYGTKRAVVADVTWVWSEFYGKHNGCKYWSDNAKKSSIPNNKLIHEHIVPKKILIEKILNMTDPSPEEIYKFLERFCIGVVVTKDEDVLLNRAKLRSKMPDDWDGNDPWARYKMVGIKVLKDGLPLKL